MAWSGSAAATAALCVVGCALAYGQVGFHPVTELGFPDTTSPDVLNARDVYLGDAHRFVIRRSRPGLPAYEIAVSQDLQTFTVLPSNPGIVNVVLGGVSRDGVDIAVSEYVTIGDRRLVRYDGVAGPRTEECALGLSGRDPQISRDGRVVVYSGVHNGRGRPFIVQDGVCEVVAPEIENETIPYWCISPDGQTVAGLVASSNLTFVWTRGVGTRFLPSGGWRVWYPRHVSNGGTRVVADDPPASSDLNVSTYGEGGWRFISWLPSYLLPVVYYLRPDGTAMMGYSDVGAMYWSPTTGEVSLADELTARGVDLRGWTLRAVSGESLDRRKFVGLGNAPGSSQMRWWVAEVEPFMAADVGRAGGVGGGDGRLDNNDFIVFINRFFASDERADVGGSGGVRSGDGAFNNNDFIAYINMFFSGEP